MCDNNPQEFRTNIITFSDITSLNISGRTSKGYGQPYITPFTPLPQLFKRQSSKC